MFEKFLNLIFPNVCGFCNKIDKNSLCENCELKLAKYRINGIKDYTKDNKKYFNYLYSALKYENEVREKIIKYKFNENSYLYKTTASPLLWQSIPVSIFIVVDLPAPLGPIKAIISPLSIDKLMLLTAF